MSEAQYYPSSDGRFFIAVGSYEMRMSHWVNSAALWRQTPRELLLELGDSLWSTDSIEWRDDSRQVMVEMRRYPGDSQSIMLDLLIDELLVVPRAPADTMPISFSSLNAFLDRFYQQHRRS